MIADLDINTITATGGVGTIVATLITIAYREIKAGFARIEKIASEANAAINMLSKALLSMQIAKESPSAAREMAISVLHELERK